MSEATELSSHLPVMPNEVIDAWLGDPQGIYVDGTFGRGGHSQLLLDRLDAQAQLYAFDRDPQAIAHGAERFAQEPRISLVNQEFSLIAEVLGSEKKLGKVNGLLVDFGVSSPQLDSAERGFSFRLDGPLNMKMNPNKGISAAEWLNSASWESIAEALAKYGEEPFAKPIANSIVKYRETKQLETTLEFAGLVESAIPEAVKRKLKVHPATRSFQAVRIKINDELGEIEKLLEQSLDILAPGGRLVVISFHSLEDRIVKRFMRDASRGANPHRGIPLREDQIQRELKLIGKKQRAKPEEIALNPRSRSAVLRVAERT